MGPKTTKEQPTEVDTKRTEFITKLSTAADAMRQFGNFADALAKVVAKTPLDDPEVVEALQNAIDAIPAPSRKRKATDLGGEEGGKRRRREKKPKDPNAPKAPPSAYILFQNEIRNAVRDQNPNIQYRELMGLISQQWNGLTAEKKKPYFDRVTAAKAVHEEALAKYNAMNPNHVPSGGTSKAPTQESELMGTAGKKATTKAAKPAQKSAETVTSTDNELSEGASDDEFSELDKDDAGKLSDVGSSDDESVAEPTPPPAKKAKKAGDRRK